MLAISNAVFHDNGAKQRGGAIYATGDTAAVSITNSSLYYNSATFGGAIYAEYPLNIMTEE